MNEDWLEWTRHNLARGCDPNEIESILKKNGFAPDEIFAAMHPPKLGFFGKLKQTIKQRVREAEAQMAKQQGGQQNGQALAPKSRIAQPNLDYKKMSRPRIVRNAEAKKFPTDRVQLYVLDNFMSAAECDAIINEINADLRPSTITTGKDYSGFRTSSTCDLGLTKHSDIVDKIDKKIARALGIRLTWSETIQGQKYEVGQEFKAHTDYFEPNTKEFNEFAGELGQRTWTFMVYLNSTPHGGETRFTALDVTFHPQRGQALIWNNLYESGEPNPDTIHHGMPVLEGQKFIITKWFRDKGSGQAFLSN